MHDWNTPTPPTPSDPAVTALLDRRLFRQWLGSHPPDATIGARGDALACPLHAYLLAAGEGLANSVQGSYVITQPAGAPVKTPLPDWARRFVVQIDAAGGKAVSAVQAARALWLYGRE